MAARLLSLAFYLPQFHTIPENDAWWGPGFTEWTHMERARPWFDGHVVRQPVPPLGRYDLLDPATVEAQHALASAHGIDAFLIWDYWLGRGKRLLERPLEMILRERLRVDYALAWGNHSWVTSCAGVCWPSSTTSAPRTTPPTSTTACRTSARSTTCGWTASRCSSSTGPSTFPTWRCSSTPGARSRLRHGLGGLWLVGDVVKAHAPLPRGFDAPQLRLRLLDQPQEVVREPRQGEPAPPAADPDQPPAVQPGAADA